MIDDRGTLALCGTRQRASETLTWAGRLAHRGSERRPGNRRSILPSIDFIRVDRLLHRL